MKRTALCLLPTADQPGYAKSTKRRTSLRKKLPTVRELADQLGIARGTVKHAYEELERKGIITMTRGKGTFIREQARQESSAKVRAMAAIERLLDEMESLSFSPQEIQMFLI